MFVRSYVPRSRDDDMGGAYRHFAFHTFLFNEPIVRRMNVTMRINTETFTKDNFLLFALVFNFLFLVVLVLV